MIATTICKKQNTFISLFSLLCVAKLYTFTVMSGALLKLRFMFVQRCWYSRTEKYSKCSEPHQRQEIEMITTHFLQFGHKFCCPPVHDGNVIIQNAKVERRCENLPSVLPGGLVTAYTTNRLLDSQGYWTTGSKQSGERNTEWGIAIYVLWFVKFFFFSSFACFSDHHGFASGNFGIS